AEGPLPVVVTYMGYSGGRGLPTEHLFWSAAGCAQLVVDSRGQGHDTPDRGVGEGTQWVGGCGSNPPVQLAWLRERGLAPTW
ncbi:acetylxylan esterase, partial [Kitasatospora sp. NPDC059827]|uniref:acetylxylan esterase n=1 Tax=Kitasatospora sp. NPDC059827 TaxID=3346964 RepID=UPI0036564901